MDIQNYGRGSNRYLANVTCFPKAIMRNNKKRMSKILGETLIFNKSERFPNAHGYAIKSKRPRIVVDTRYAIAPLVSFSTAFLPSPLPSNLQKDFSLNLRPATYDFGNYTQAFNILVKSNSVAKDSVILARPGSLSSEVYPSKFIASNGICD